MKITKLFAAMFVCVVISIIGGGITLAAGISDEDAAKLFEAMQQDPETIRCKELADKGDTQAVSEFAYRFFILGNTYAHERQDTWAVKSWMIAAEYGHAGAQFGIGWCYENGVGGLSKDNEKARYWYSKAAAQGLEEAQKKLGAGKTFWGIERSRQEQFEKELTHICEKYSQEITSHVSSFTRKLGMGYSHAEMWVEHVPDVVSVNDEEIRILAHIKITPPPLSGSNPFEIRISSAGLLDYVNGGYTNNIDKWSDVPDANFAYSPNPPNLGTGMKILTSVNDFLRDDNEEATGHIIYDTKTNGKQYFSIPCQTCAKIIGRFLEDASRLARKYTR